MRRRAGETVRQRDREIMRRREKGKVRWSD